MSTRRRKFTLWGGPQDGGEITTIPGQVEFYIVGPPKMPDTPGEIRPNGETPMYKGLYEYNSAEQRFDWRGYE